MVRVVETDMITIVLLAHTVQLKNKMPAGNKIKKPA